MDANERRKALTQRIKMLHEMRMDILIHCRSNPEAWSSYNLISAKYYQAMALRESLWREIGDEFYNHDSYLLYIDNAANSLYRATHKEGF